MWDSRVSWNGIESITNDPELSRPQMIRRAKMHGCELLLVPVQDIQPANQQGEPACRAWIASTSDPEFEVIGLEEFRGQWVRMQFRLEVDRDEWSWPRLSFDLGTGDFNGLGVPFPRATALAPDVELVFNVPTNLRATRLRPVARPGKFGLGTVKIEVVGKLRAVGHMLRVIAATDGFSRAVRMLADTIAPTADPASRWEARHQIARRYMDVQSGERGYADWIQVFEAKSNLISGQGLDSHGWSWQPAISVLIPVCSTNAPFLHATLDSVRQQTYPNWELCIACDQPAKALLEMILRNYAEGDSRIRVVYRNTNGHMAEASNLALAQATGDWVVLLAAEDCLHPQALHFVAEAIVTHSFASLIYSDEDKLDSNDERYDPYFKCSYNYELLLAHNTVRHLAAFRRSLVADVGGFRREFEGAENYDLVLRVIERLCSDQVLHLPRVLYHKRATSHTSLTSSMNCHVADAGRRAVAEHLQRRGVHGSVVPAPEAPTMNRVRYSLPQPNPKVSLIICTRDRLDLLAPCIDSIVERSTYSNYEVVIVDNGSVEEDTVRFLDGLPCERFRILRDDSAFNFSALNNRAVQAASGEYVCLLNNDIKIITVDWMEELLSFSTQPDIGAVGARLWYPNGKLQHAGVILGLVGVSNHVHRNLKRGELGYFGRAALHQSFSAVTGAALMIKKSLFIQVGGMDEELLVTFNDIDFCLRVREAGYRNVWTPYAEMIHYESATRGRETTLQETARAEQETLLMKRRWGHLLRSDPAYSINLSIEAEDLRLAWPPRIEAASKRTAVERNDAVALVA